MKTMTIKMMSIMTKPMMIKPIQSGFARFSPLSFAQDYHDVCSELSR
ncbi:hypothetical protein SAMN02745127_02302 [Oceanospirillum multiglobuliferum]|nr:hypothetical protein [Oceanospirillum multiglobuliferum]SKA13722.1 hypothetical protein SAMN02745127_02302 [Oceanospirillum multiglobuliferum]